MMSCKCWVRSLLRAFNTFPQLGEEEREEQVVESPPAGGGAAEQGTAFLVNNMVDHGLACKVSF